MKPMKRVRNTLTFFFYFPFKLSSRKKLSIEDKPGLWRLFVQEELEPFEWRIYNTNLKHIKQSLFKIVPICWCAVIFLFTKYALCSKFAELLRLY